jgi:hypothetical protein
MGETTHEQKQLIDNTRSEKISEKYYSFKAFPL